MLRLSLALSYLRSTVWNIRYKYDLLMLLKSEIYFR